MLTITTRPRAVVGMLLASVILALGLAQPHTASAATCANSDTPFAVPSRFAGESTESYSLRVLRLQSEVRDAIVCLTNNERTSRGLVALTKVSALARAAQSHATDMVRNRYFSHTGLNGSTPLSRARAAGYCTSSAVAVSENILWQSGSPTARQVVQSWMNSTGHRANILRAERRHIGVGAEFGTPTGVKGGTFVQLFGTCG